MLTCAHYSKYCKCSAGDHSKTKINWFSPKGGKKEMFLSVSFKRGHFRYLRKKAVINLGCFP